MDFVYWLLAVIVALGLLGMGAYRLRQRRCRSVAAAEVAAYRVDKNPFAISYAPSQNEWSGSNTGALPLKTLTYKQYECLEDARYGFKIVGVTPSARKDAQPDKTRAHSQKTVASLAKHGFLTLNDENVYVITDRGLNALEVCDVRY